MIMQILVMPIVHYMAIIVLFILYLIFKWKKDSSKQNKLIVLLCMLLLFSVRFGRDWEAIYFLDSFHSDTILIKSENKSVSVELDDLFEGDYGGSFRKQSIIDTVKRLNQEPYVELYFYKDNKQKLKLNVYRVDDENEYEYVSKINDNWVIVTYNADLTELSAVFYQNLSKILNEIE